MRIDAKPRKGRTLPKAEDIRSNERIKNMGKGRQVSPVLAGIIIVVVIVVLGLIIWKQTNRSFGVSGVGSTSAALAKPGQAPMVKMPPKPVGGAAANIPMPGRTTTVPVGPRR